MSETPAAAPRLSSRKLVRSLGAALLLALILPSVDRGPLANALVDVSTLRC